MSDAGARTFTVINTLGRGGFGEVYQAEMRSPSGLLSTVAVKVLHTGLDPRSQAVMRLKDEGHILSLLRHPAIVAVHDLAVLDGRVALVTEFVEGADLPDCVTGPDPMPLGAILEALAGVAGALHAAHEAVGPNGEKLGLLHRDVKPGNIRVGRHGQVKLLDFGIATASGLTREANTQTNALIGSFPFMAPERFRRGQPVGPPSDFYSLGCALYEAVAGRRLFDSDEMAEIFAGKASEEAHSAVVSRGLDALDAPEGVRKLVADLVAFDPDARPTGPQTIARLEDLASEAGGHRLGRWARERTWTESPAASDPGPLSGRTLTDGDVVPSTTTAMHLDDEVAPAAGRSWGRILAAIAILLVLGLTAGGALGAGGLVFGWWMTMTGTDVHVSDPVPDGPEPDGPEPDGPDGPDGPEPGGPDGPDGPEPDGPDGPDGPEPTGPEPTGPSPKPEPGGTAVSPRPDAPDPAPTTGAASGDCGDVEALEARATGGKLTAGDRACLGRAARDGSLRMVDRRKVARVSLVDAKARCDAGSCADYEREQAYYFEELDQSDPEMMFAWATHLEKTGRRAEARIWVQRALERKEGWSGQMYTKRVEGLHALDAKAAYALWNASPRDERLRIEARDAAAEWASYRAQLGRDTTAAMEMCTSAAGSAGPCEDRVHDNATKKPIVFASVPGGAEVVVDGAVIGNTPVSFDLSLGAHDVQIRAQGLESSQRIEVGTGKPTRWTWTAEGDDWKGALN
ncbi:MAG: serine/threonine protein kinase [Alphaproteobacteria bacterium]|nr:serine/threonine protein kinase [Alphaproteobacteria bacterium]